MSEVKTKYIDEDFNCAETTLRLANERYSLGITDSDLKLISGFGGGLYSEKTCGMLSATIAVLGRLAVKERAHVTPEFNELCADCVKKFEEHFGSCDCCNIKAKYKKSEELRCLDALEEGYKFLTEYIDDYLKRQEN